MHNISQMQVLHTRLHIHQKPHSVYDLNCSVDVGQRIPIFHPRAYLLNSVSEVVAAQTLANILNRLRPRNVLYRTTDRREDVEVHAIAQPPVRTATKDDVIVHKP